MLKCIYTIRYKYNWIYDRDNINHIINALALFLFGMFDNPKLFPINLKKPIITIEIENQRVDILRLDTIHPYISGNKWFKLKYHIQQAVDAGATGILTFGGAYSNHLVAAASMCALVKLDCVCIVRGEAPAVFNNRLNYLQTCHAQLHFISRTDYTLKENSMPAKNILAAYPGLYIIPEGGAGEPGVTGSMEILDGVSNHYDYICCTAGTCTMAAGLARCLQPHQKLLVFPAIRVSHQPVYASELAKSIYGYLNQPPPVIEFITDYHFGGYAQSNDTLLNFIQEFENQFGIKTDRVYNGKMFYGLADLMKHGYFSKTARLLAVHCGGVFPGEPC